MKFTPTTVFSSINSYRDWFLVLIFLLLSASGIAVMDARFFLSATRQADTSSQELLGAEFKKEELSRVAAMLQEKEKRFNALRR